MFFHSPSEYQKLRDKGMCCALFYLKRADYFIKGFNELTFSQQNQFLIRLKQQYL
jgi:hypothetical protein